MESRKIFIALIISLLIFVSILGAYYVGKNSSSIATQENYDEIPTFAPSLESTTAKELFLSVTPPDNLRTKIITGLPDLDGYRWSSGNGNNSQEIKIGRNPDSVARGFVAFDISDLPKDVIIEDATLRLYQEKIIGHPYQIGGSIKIDHLTYGDNLDESDYGSPALISNFQTLPPGTQTGWKEIDVLPMLKDDIANARSTSQYRLHMQTEITGGTGEGDFIIFESGDNTLGTTYIPQLVIKYY